LGGYSRSENSGDKTQASQGGIDYWIVKTDANGVKQWDVRFGGSAYDVLLSLHQLPMGAISSEDGLGQESAAIRHRQAKQYGLLDRKNRCQWYKTVGCTVMEEMIMIISIPSNKLSMAALSSRRLLSE
jgi:hypothetical protein